MPEVYVSTYALYNSGSLKGKWFNLEEYPCKQDFLEACQEFHGEGEHEFMFQDWSEIPVCFISESYINPEFWDYMGYDDHHQGKAKEAYCEYFDEWDETKFEDSFRGKYDSVEAYAEEHVTDSGLLFGVPEVVANYFNYEDFARDLELSGDVVWTDGFIFVR